jgi:hypothetical protein
VRGILSTIFITNVTTENTELIGTVPILWTFLIETTIVANPNAVVIIAFVASIAIPVEHAHFTFTGILTAVRLSFGTIPTVSAALFAVVNITVFVLGT